MRPKTVLLPILLVVALPLAMATTYVALGIAGAKGDVLGYVNTLTLLGVVVFWVASLWYTFRLVRGTGERVIAVLAVLFVTFILYNLSMVFGSEEFSGCWSNGVKIDCPTGTPLEAAENRPSEGRCFQIVEGGVDVDVPCPTPLPETTSSVDWRLEGRCSRFIKGKYLEFPCPTETP